METSNRPFSNRQLRDMIVPLFFEQLLVMLVGLADTLVVSYAGEAAVSGVSLVNQFNTIFIYLFTALASGGAVVISQYVGRRAGKKPERQAASCCCFPPFFRWWWESWFYGGTKACCACCLGRWKSR